jgi:hypothetical protein
MRKREKPRVFSMTSELVDTLGIPIAEALLVHHRETHARLLVGTGRPRKSSHAPESWERT